MTLDLDFANPLLFLPSQYCGIAVLRLPNKPSAIDLDRVIETLAAALAKDSVDGKLWMIEAGRVRVIRRRRAIEQSHRTICLIAGSMTGRISVPGSAMRRSLEEAVWWMSGVEGPV